MDQTFADGIRYANAIIAFVAVVLWSRSYVVARPAMTVPARHVTFWVGALLVVALYGSVEAAQQDAPVGLRVFLLLVSLVGLTGALVRDEATRS